MSSKKPFAVKEKVVIIIALAVIGIGIIYSAYKYSQRFAFDGNLAEYGIPDEFANYGSVPDDIVYNGKTYKYNKDVASILLFGYDKTDERVKTGLGYQADTLLLLAVNRKTGDISIINIPRDTLTEVAVFNFMGQYAYLQPYQIAVSHGYGGEDDELASQLTLAAVSNLLHHIPITRYAAMDIDGIGPITESIGGVEMELKAGFEMFNPKMLKGVIYNLKGDEAELYLRSRQIPGMSGKDSQRMKIQIDFVQEFIKALKSKVKENPLVILDLLKAANPHVKTNITLSEAIELIPKLLKISISSDAVTKLPGHTNRYEGITESVYIPDQEELIPLLLDTYFVEVD